MSINPTMLIGNWDEGYALDRHVISSVPIGEDPYGYMQFNTKRSEMGELIYHFKYKGKYRNLDKIIELAKPFIIEWAITKSIDIVLPVPSSNEYRLYQPAFEIAKAIADLLNVGYNDTVLQKISSLQSKSLNQDEKQKISGTIIKRKMANKEHNLLLVDDLYQTGTTLTECVNEMRKDDKVLKIYVLTMTKTKR